MTYSGNAAGGYPGFSYTLYGTINGVVVVNNSGVLDSNRSQGGGGGFAFCGIGYNIPKKYIVTFSGILYCGCYMPSYLYGGQHIKEADLDLPFINSTHELEYHAMVGAYRGCRSPRYKTQISTVRVYYGCPYNNSVNENVYVDIPLSLYFHGATELYQSSQYFGLYVDRVADSRFTGGYAGDIWIFMVDSVPDCSQTSTRVNNYTACSDSYGRDMTRGGSATITPVFDMNWTPNPP
jgi:hypothetical protein